ncbi:MAG: hypothetical protein MJZ75_04370 [Paludibacteraceae bacterium]|nr:hypothetical protein [Paludibacteraceae bacterium]
MIDRCPTYARPMLNLCFRRRFAVGPPSAKTHKRHIQDTYPKRQRNDSEKEAKRKQNHSANSYASYIRPSVDRRSTVGKDPRIRGRQKGCLQFRGQRKRLQLEEEKKEAA